MFASQTIQRLFEVLRGMFSAATLVMLAAGLWVAGSDRGGATLSLMGLALGATAGVPLGGLLRRRSLAPADQRLSLLAAMFCLPLAVLPVQSAVPAAPWWGETIWSALVLDVTGSMPLGLCVGLAWSLWPAGSASPAPRWPWIGLGVLLGGALACASVLILSTLRGAFLVNLFLAPLLWPTLPASGPRSLLARMLLTLAVVISTMFLLFI